MTKPITQNDILPAPCGEQPTRNNWGNARRHIDDLNDAVGDLDDDVAGLQANNGKVKVAAAGALQWLLNAFNWVNAALVFDANLDLKIEVENNSDKVRPFVDLSDVTGYNSSRRQALIHKEGYTRYATIAFCHVYMSTSQNQPSSSATETVEFDSIHKKELSGDFSINSSYELTVRNAGYYEVSLCLDCGVRNSSSSTVGVRCWIERYDAASTSWIAVEESQARAEIRLSHLQATASRPTIIIDQTADNIKYRVRVNGVPSACNWTIYGRSNPQGSHWFWRRMLT